MVWRGIFRIFSNLKARMGFALVVEKRVIFYIFLESS